MNKDKIIQIVQEISTNIDYDSLSDKEKLTVLVNLILLTLKNNLPQDLIRYSDSLLSNGKELGLQLLTYKNNPALQIALKAHLILDISQKL